MKKKYFILTCIFIFFLSNINSQTIFYQGIFHGGVTGAGFSTGISGAGTTGNIEVHIAPNSTIKQAFLVFNRYRNAPPIEIQFNSTLYKCDSTNKISNYLVYPNITTDKEEVHLIDVTESVNPLQNNYSITIPPQSALAFYGCFYLIVLYENSGLPKIAYSLILNKLDATQIVNYNINPLCI